ncbi:tRNA (adenosine(37)-N6)-dimethylallyltransferase MiaA [Helicobacter sp. MIT 00-7814]|uniref:tRNA (adenosine(37)-N6)-dimethylallyltransferase MiaA n=1 Tax=unclassified Helicobacter TaxID=2593540 RepID=UPI000E1E8CBD|nr:MULTISPECIES: tRNA (adenosine(37)-N6)-dimethylallyltransferase MiaA [unclassified Helicobacter]RDU55289.1 tRNA (adenosine(37)-N6)-dimethylallyltransferase MiaA [Helicobacter sp. MIT 99-10781]RDU56127.1 tRNA (adenosine(37)-N6)-dimethylallyltransferase MiaA [Helicobacter sp. MIT 00-7814]
MQTFKADSQTPKIIALLGASASGKSALALELAKAHNGAIFSLDSLSIYKYINIASAKPTQAELQEVKHYAIDVLEPDLPCNAMTFWDLLTSAFEETRAQGKKALFIVGGSSFYLKSMLEGLSPQSQMNAQSRAQVQEKIHALSAPYEFLARVDNEFALTIKPNDTYRLQKALEIYFATNLPPSVYFKENPKQKHPLLENLPLFVLSLPRDEIIKRIKARTQKMLDSGLLEEVAFLAQNYPLDSQALRAIGIKECLEFLGYQKAQNPQSTQPLQDFQKSPQNLQDLCALISTHTAQLAKRQSTFNRTQFRDAYFGSTSQIATEIARILA